MSVKTHTERTPTTLGTKKYTEDWSSINEKSISSNSFQDLDITTEEDIKTLKDTALVLDKKLCFMDTAGQVNIRTHRIF